MFQWGIHSFIHSFSKHLLNVYSLPSTGIAEKNAVESMKNIAESKRIWQIQEMKSGCSNPDHLISQKMKEKSIFIHLYFEDKETDSG